MNSSLKWYNFLSFKRIIILIIVLLILFSMSFFGLNKYNNSISNTSIIKVGNIEVPSQLFFAEFNLILQQNASAINQNPYLVQNILKGMLSKYVSSLLFVNEANSLYIGANNDLIYKIIANTPFFKGNDGKFNKDLFQKSVNQVYGSEDEYISLLKNDLKQNQLTGSIVSTLYEPKKLVEYNLSALSQNRTVNYIVISRNNIKNLGTPTNKELTDILNQNKDAYTKPEYRSLSIVNVKLTDYLKNISVSEDEIKKYYDKNKNNYMGKESRDISQILVNDQETANKIYNKLKNSTSLNTANYSVTTLKKVTQTTLPQEIANTIFSAKEKTIQKPIKTDLGYEIFIVNKIYPPSPLPLKDVEKNIKAEISGDKMSNLYEDLKNNLSNVSRSGESMESISKKFKGQFIYIKSVNQYGFDTNNNALTGIVENKDLLSTAFTLPLNQTSDVITSKNNLFLVKVNNIIPKHIESLLEARNDLISQWKYNKTSIIIQKQAEAVVSKVSKTPNLHNLGYIVKTIKLTRLKQQQNNPFNNYNMEQIFLSKRNNPIQGRLNNDDIFIALVKQINNNTLSGLSIDDKNKINDYIKNTYNESILSELFNNLNKKYKVSINQKELEQKLKNN